MGPRKDAGLSHLFGKAKTVVQTHLSNAIIFPFINKEVLTC